MRIAVGNDHTGVELKETIISYLQEKGHEITDYGTNTLTPCEYPVYGSMVGKAVAKGEQECGILICGTGIGISLAANKIKGVRAAVCSEPYSAQLAKRHNNANIIAFGARVVGSEMAKMIVDHWLEAEFEGGIHEMRVNMVMELETEGACGLLQNTGGQNGAD